MSKVVRMNICGELCVNNEKKMFSFSNNEFANCKDNISPQLPEVLKCLIIKPTQMKVATKKIISDDTELLDLKQRLRQPSILTVLLHLQSEGSQY